MVITKIANPKHLAYILNCKTSVEELQEITTQLADKAHHFDAKHYREKINISITRAGKEKKRIIHPSKGRLKVIQKSIKDKILNQIKFPAYVQGGVKGGSNISNASKHLGRKFKFTTDIKKFFPSITPEQVYAALSSLQIPPDVCRLLTLLITYKGKVPQGASTSVAIANLVFSEIDNKINNFCIEHNLLYTRYIDDVTISGVSDFKGILPELIRFITQAGFPISSKKTFYKGVLDITGIKVGNNTMKPNDKFYEKLEDSALEKGKEARLQYLLRIKKWRKRKENKTNRSSKPSHLKKL